MAIHDAVSGEWFYQDAGSGEGIKLIATSVRLALPSLSYKQGGGGRVAVRYINSCQMLRTFRIGACPTTKRDHRMAEWPQKVCCENKE